MQIETPADPEKPPGACCKPSMCLVTGEAACAADNGMFLGSATACSACAAMSNARGACCAASNKCFPGNTKALCDSNNGMLKVGQECGACFGSGGSQGGGGMPDMPGVTTAMRGNCCAKGSCYQGHTAASCAAVDTKARFIGAELCARCFEPEEPEISDACKKVQVDFCHII